MNGNDRDGAPFSRTSLLGVPVVLNFFVKKWLSSSSRSECLVYPIRMPQCVNHPFHYRFARFMKITIRYSVASLRLPVAHLDCLL